MRNQHDTILDYWLKGHTVDAIVSATGATKKSVLACIKKTREDWREQACAQIDGEIQRELAKLDLIERECWVAWATEYVNGETGYVTLPNPAYMKTILECMTRRAKLLGLDKPTKIMNSYDFSKLTTEQLQRIANGETVEKVIGNTDA